MFWLFILGVATCLGIALRRVLRRQGPLDDELYSKKVAVDHVQSGVAWVRGDTTFGSVNQSFANTFRMTPRDLTGKEWYKVFSADDQTRIREIYSQMMLRGMTSFEVTAVRADGSLAWLNVRLVAVHDGHMRFVGHHCMIEDKTREHELEAQVQALKTSLAEKPAPAVYPPSETLSSAAETLRRSTARSMISVLSNARKAPARELGSTIAEAS